MTRSDDCNACGGSGGTWVDTGDGDGDWEPCYWCQGLGTERLP